jgi:hypothetical protein
MAKIGISKESLQGLPDLEAGIYEFRIDGFKPKTSSKKTSINLNPQLIVINHSKYNDRHIWHNCNSAFPPGMIDLCHSVGVRFDNEDGDDPQFPGEFVPDGAPIEQTSYQGPLMGQIGKCEVAESDDGKGGKTMKLKRFFCVVPGCTHKHSEDLR